MFHHPNLDPRICHKIDQSEKDGGLDLTGLIEGDEVHVQTQNTLYKIKKAEDRWFHIEGHAKYCPTPTRGRIQGSTFGGSMLKLNFLGINMHMEMVLDGWGVVTTTAIKEIHVFRWKENKNEAI